MRESHASRQQRGKKHVCSARMGELGMLTCGSCGHNNQHKKDVRKCSVFQQVRICQTLLSVPTSEISSDAFTKTQSQADAGSHRKLENT